MEKTENSKCTSVDLGNSIFKPYGNYCRVTFQHTGQLGKFGIFLESVDCTEFVKSQEL